MFGVEAAYEAADLAARDPLDRLAEHVFGCVLEEHARVAQSLVLSHPREIALRGGEIIDTVHARRAPMIPVSTSLRP